MREFLKTTVYAVVMGGILYVAAYWQDVIVNVTDALMKLY